MARVCYVFAVKVWQLCALLWAIMAYVRPLWLRRLLTFALLFSTGIGG